MRSSEHGDEGSEFEEAQHIERGHAIFGKSETAIFDGKQGSFARARFYIPPPPFHG